MGIVLILGAAVLAFALMANKKAAQRPATSLTSTEIAAAVQARSHQHFVWPLYPGDQDQSRHHENAALQPGR